MFLFPKTTSTLTSDLDRMGFDTLATKPLSDFFQGTSAADIFDGGSGSDTVSYHTSTAAIGVNLLDTASEKGGYAARDQLISIENIIGSEFNDTITGTTGANLIHGNDGNDIIQGNGGNDVLFGGAGNDTITGAPTNGGRLIMDGGSGNDTLKVGALFGTSQITTGSGNDLVEIDITGSNFKVVIKDFNPYWETAGNAVTTAEALNGDRLDIDFTNLTGLSLNAVSAHQRIIDGDDLILRFTNSNVQGDIVFEDLGQRVDLVGGVFRIDMGFISGIEAV